MKISRLAALVGQSIRRNTRNFILSSLGIVIGIGALLFFTALGLGVQQTVLERVFVIKQLEVVKPSYDFGSFKSEGLFGGVKLNDQMAERLRDVDGVSEVFPKMKLTFPSSIRGGEALLGKDMWGELIADGIPPDLVADEVEIEDMAFVDYENISCSDDSSCPSGYACDEGVCRGVECSDDADCEGNAYCTQDDVCAMPIPVLANPSLLEIYNGSIQTAMGGASGAMGKLPQLSESALLGFGALAVFGKSYLGSSKRNVRIERRVKLVGFSEKALPLGLTMPIGYVQRLNREVVGDEAAEEYHSIVVDAVSNDRVAAVARTITEDLGLALSSRYQNAQRAGLLILLITLIFNLVSLVFLLIAAINIMHTFLMMILERRRELALMRAVGAPRSSIRWLVLGEATALGLFGGLVGVAGGYTLSRLVDWLLANYVPAFPYKPESLFVFEMWMILGALGVAVLFCWIGALLPAIRAGRIDPAAALAGR